jgi:glyoxylase-like metal-dependent hydrolase (beta-lactamase superfamily II)
MLSWKIGDVTVTRVVEFENEMPYDPVNPFIPDAKPDALKAISWLSPNFVTSDGALRISVHALLIDAPGLKLVVDTCIGNDKPRQLLGGIALNTAFLKCFAETGWTRDEVDAVICTHLHIDHVGWNTMLENGRWVPTFPKARYLLGREEYAHWTSGAENEVLDQAEIMADSVKPIFDAGLVTLVEMDHRISNELRLVPTPGHTPGHVSLVIESRGETAIITGDVMHHPCQIARPDWATLTDSELSKANAIRESMLADCANKPVLLIGTHFSPPTAGYIRREGTGYRFEGAKQSS